MKRPMRDCFVFLEDPLMARRPSWLLTPGTVLLRRHVRNKGDPFCDPVELVEGDPTYSVVRLPDGRLIYRGTLIAATTAWGSWPSYFTASVERAFLLLSEPSSYYTGGEALHAVRSLVCLTLTVFAMKLKQKIFSKIFQVTPKKNLTLQISH